jgi:5-methylcytosine-specific restriction endonuclease McrA
VPKGRLNWCGEACIHEHKLRSNPGYLRAQTWKRDRGICASCGVDCKAAKLGWQADHIIPVVEGGGECGLDNIRTLCTPCHRRETASLAARRAQARRSVAC